MSLTHILETARKLGIPVILTNERGDSPQVVMPFEDFASMVGVSVAPVGKRPRLSKIKNEEDEEDEDEEIAQALADLAREEMEEQIRREPIDIDGSESDHFVAEESGNPTVDDTLMLEEKFSFEPIDDAEEKR